MMVRPRSFVPLEALAVVHTKLFPRSKYWILNKNRTSELGCYINRRGIPRRSAGYLRWETKATAFAHPGNGEHVLLFSPEFIEVRTVGTGRLVQVIEGEDIRLVHASERAVLVAMKGPQDADKLVELIETAELSALGGQDDGVPSGVWDEWDNGM